MAAALLIWMSIVGICCIGTWRHVQKAKEFSFLLNEDVVMLTRNMIIALTMATSAAIATVLAFQRNAKQLERTRQKMDLQRWENETGSVLPLMAEDPLP